MFRPLSQALYDYRRTTYTQKDSQMHQKFKRPYFQACMFIGADNIIGNLSPGGGNLDDLINEWNNQSSKIIVEEKQQKLQEKDYKSGLDEIFENNGKAYYKKRQKKQPQRQMQLSKEKSQDRRDQSRSREAKSIKEHYGYRQEGARQGQRHMEQVHYGNRYRPQHTRSDKHRY